MRDIDWGFATEVAILGCLLTVAVLVCLFGCTWLLGYLVQRFEKSQEEENS